MTIFPFSYKRRVQTLLLLKKLLVVLIFGDKFNIKSGLIKESGNTYSYGVTRKYLQHRLKGLPTINDKVPKTTGCKPFTPIFVYVSIRK